MTPRNVTLFLAAGVMIVTAGLVHGVMTHRWSSNDIHQTAAEGLHQLPDQFGDWICCEQLLTDEAIHFAGLSGYVYRQYVNQRTQQSVTLLLMCGLPGPVSVHPPTACFRGAGFKQIGSTERVTVETDSQSHVFQVADFEQPGSLSVVHPQILWAWSTNGLWASPSRPRFEFASARVLYKVYISTLTEEATPRSADPLLLEFLREVLPHVKASIATRH